MEITAPMSGRSQRIDALRHTDNAGGNHRYFIITPASRHCGTDSTQKNGPYPANEIAQHQQISRVSRIAITGSWKYERSTQMIVSLDFNREKFPASSKHTTDHNRRFQKE